MLAIKCEICEQFFEVEEERLEKGPFYKMYCDNCILLLGDLKRDAREEAREYYKKRFGKITANAETVIMLLECVRKEHPKLWKEQYGKYGEELLNKIFEDRKESKAVEKSDPIAEAVVLMQKGAPALDFMGCNCTRISPPGHHWEGCPMFDPQTMLTKDQYMLLTKTQPSTATKGQ